MKSRQQTLTLQAHLNVPLKVKEVDSLPVAAIQSQNIPGLSREGETDI